MTNLICKINTPTTKDKTYQNVKKIFAELNDGIIEIYPDHQDLIGTIETGRIDVHESINDQNIITTYLIQYGALTIKNESDYTLVEVYAQSGLEFTKDVTFELAKQQFEGHKKEFLSIFKLIKPQEEIEKIDFGPFDRIMEENFHRLQSEMFFWQEVMEILKENE